MTIYDIKKDLKILKGVLSFDSYCFNGTDCSLYPFSNEEIKKYYNYKDLTGKSALCITGSGDHSLFCALAGAKNIVSVDINPLAKYFSALKIAIIKAYDKKYFCKIFTNEGIIKKIKLSDLREFMDEEIFEFWDRALKIIYGYSDYNNRLFRFDGGPFCSFYDYYNEIKEKLFELNILYHDCDVTWLSNEYENYFDAIFLSNCAEWADNHLEFLRDVSEYLVQNGVLYDYEKWRIHSSKQEQLYYAILNYNGSGCNIYCKKHFR